WVRERLQRDLTDRYRHFDLDIRDRAGLGAIFARYSRDVALVVHTAAQPSHDWAAGDPAADFGINATGTSNVLECARQFCPESMTIDASTHSLFGVSKTAADLLVQEYGRYFGMRTVCFRAGCLTGPNHSGTMLDGFLAYLMKCVCTGTPYTVFGYKGKQVRDNLHGADLVTAFDAVVDA